VRNGVANVFGTLHVRDGDRGAAAERFDFRLHPGKCAACAAYKRNRGALASQGEGNAAAYALAGAGDDGYLGI
jgi:hypothetical protein